MAEPHGQLMRYKKRRRRPSLFLRLRARGGEFRASARVTFFFCKKKVTKENRSNLRFKDPLARGGFRRCGGESVSPWRGGGLRRPHFFLRRKKCGKESRLDLRSKDPWRAMGYAKLAVLISRNWRGGGRCRFGGSLVPLAPLPLTAVRVGVGAVVEWRLSNRAHCGAKHRNG